MPCRFVSHACPKACVCKISFHRWPNLKAQVIACIQKKLNELKKPDCIIALHMHDTFKNPCMPHQMCTFSTCPTPTSLLLMLQSFSMTLTRCTRLPSYAMRSADVADNDTAVCYSYFVGCIVECCICAHHSAASISAWCFTEALASLP